VLTTESDWLFAHLDRGPDDLVLDVAAGTERLRDPAHARVLTQNELLDMITAAGLTATSVESRQIERPLAPWLEQTATDAAVRTEIEHRLAIELEGGEPTGFQPRRDDGTLLFTQAFASVVATKP
jgi:hypothetical protein